MTKKTLKKHFNHLTGHAWPIKILQIKHLRSFEVRQKLGLQDFHT